MLISELKYEAYKFQRASSPEIIPERWKLIFGQDVDWMEKRLNQEKLTQYPQKEEGNDHYV